MMKKKLNSEIWHCLNGEEDNLPYDGANIVFIYKPNFGNTKYGISSGIFYKVLEERVGNGFLDPHCGMPNKQNYPLAWAYIDDIINDLFE